MRYEDANWQKAMRLKVDYNNMLAGYSKAEAAITPEEIAALKDKAAQAFQFIAQNRGKGTMEWSELPYNQEEVVADILQEAKAIREKCDTFVVLGIGGSALGPIAVQQALNHLNYNELPAEKRGGPRVCWIISTRSASAAFWILSTLKRRCSTSSPSPAPLRRP